MVASTFDVGIEVVAHFIIFEGKFCRTTNCKISFYDSSITQQFENVGAPNNIPIILSDALLFLLQLLFDPLISFWYHQLPPFILSHMYNPDYDWWWFFLSKNKGKYMLYISMGCILVSIISSILFPSVCYEYSCERGMANCILVVPTLYMYVWWPKLWIRENGAGVCKQSVKQKSQKICNFLDIF